MSNQLPSSTATSASFGSLLNGNAGTASGSSGESINTLIAAIVAALVSSGVQFFVFVILRNQLSRIYRPKTYLVAERERVSIPPAGIFGWIKPIFFTQNLDYLQKCGLDAYFFLRFLQMLLKIFFPMAVVLLPILLPVNQHGGVGQAIGLDTLSISNIGPSHSGWLWAHLIMAVGAIFWTCWVIYSELRSYIRVRQAYLTSPQHRIRASATTVLVTEIPKKWLTHEALEGLYDVFPGGLKNVWINRNFDELAEKVEMRDKIAKSLEDAETVLIKKCREADQKAREKQSVKRTKSEKKQDDAQADQDAERLAQGEGTTAGDVDHQGSGLQEALRVAEEEERRREEQDHVHAKAKNPLDIVGNGFGALKTGLGRGVGGLGNGLGHLGQKVLGDVDQGFRAIESGADKHVDRLNRGQGFAYDTDVFVEPEESYGQPPSPPPKTGPAEPSQSVGTRKVGEGDKHSQESAVPQSISADRSLESPTTSSTEQTTTPAKDVHTLDVVQSSDRFKPRPSLHIETSAPEKPNPFWKFWKTHDSALVLPSPQPHASEETEFPLTSKAILPPDARKSKSKWAEKFMFWKSNDEEKVEYPAAVVEKWDDDQDGEPRWREFIEPDDRETMRLPALSYSWFPSLPLVGKKVDRIYHLRRELARLNLEIEADQQHADRFPLMGSAFIQFNHQVAAHMAVQSVSHHVPQKMAPRTLEISPDDVIWTNMSIKWWERYLRTVIVLAIIVGMIVLFAIPVAFTGFLSNISDLKQTIPWLAWLNRLPPAVISIIQGVLPPVLLSVLLSLVPVVMRVLVRQQGVPTGNAREQGVQVWYFVFLWIQVFFVVTISGGLGSFFSTVANDPTRIPQTLAKDLPAAANYFFSYLTIQSLSNSAGALLQGGTLFVWFLLAPIMDSTAREKFRRQTTLNRVQWGSFFPPFTNFAVIGVIYSVISPLILVFMLVIFSVFWLVYRYNVLYVYRFRNDTGGLLFPTAVNQLFVGLYVEELCLIGIFFTKRNEQDNVAALPQAIIMIVLLVATVLFQILLNYALKPLFQYLPITLEDEAVVRDEKFAREQAARFEPLMTHDDSAIEEHGEKDAYEMEETQRRGSASSERAAEKPPSRQRGGWARRTSAVPPSPHGRAALHRAPLDALNRLKILNGGNANGKKSIAKVDPQRQNSDMEAQRTVADVLFGGFADELEDLTPEERDLLTRYAFQHSAMRAKRPVVWIPGDKLRVSDDEIRRARKMSTVFDEHDGGEKTYIAMSNKGTALDAKGRVVFRQSPPDFESVDLIAL